MRKRQTLVVGLALAGLGGLALAQDPGIQAVVGNVFLQDDTPGLAQIGHANIKGTFRAGQVNVTSVNATIPFIGNNTAPSGSTVGGSFSAASPSGIALRGTATSATGFASGVYGEARSPNGIGVSGRGKAGIGVFGLVDTGPGAGVWARSTSAAAPAMRAENFAGGPGAVISGDVTLENTSDLFLKSGNSVIMKTQVQGNGGEFRIQGPDLGDFSALSSFPTFSAITLERNSQILVQGRIGSDNVGRLTAQVKNFVQPDPDNELRDIVYACVEGPEAAAYVRGTASLVNGSAQVALPRHFQNVTAEGMTVQLTPLSSDSKGLAVVAKSLSGFRVVELHRGHGTYEFDWEVKAVRRGFTDYEVYRPWDDGLLADSDRTKALEGRRENAREVFGIRYAGPRP